MKGVPRHRPFSQNLGGLAPPSARVCLVAGLLACGAWLSLAEWSARCFGAPQELIEASITLEVAPGETGAPRETITLSLKTDRTASLQIQRTSANDTQVDRSNVEANEFRAAWDIVVLHKLRAWLPDEALDASDFGEQRLRIAWRPRGTTKPQMHEVAWIHPLRNAEAVDALTAQMARLAKKYLRKLPPLYLQ